MADETRKDTTRTSLVLAMAGGLLALMIAAMILIGFLAELAGDRIDAALQRHLPKIPPLLRDLQADILPWFPLILIAIGLLAIVLLCFIISGISRLNESLAHSNDESKRSTAELVSLKYQIAEWSKAMQERSNRST